MVRKLVSIVEIDSVARIENSDFLSVATMKGKGWKVVVKNDEFKPGDIGVYFEIDSALPIEDARYSFLSNCAKTWRNCSPYISKYVIKTRKLRGVISQGLLLPISVFPEIDPIADRDLDLREKLGVRHVDDVNEEVYQKAIEQGRISGGSPSNLSEFPGFIQKTDEERIQNLMEYFSELEDHTFEVTEKNDGSSMTIFYKADLPEEKFGVCSRNKQIDREENAQWRIAEKYEKTITDYCEKTGRNLAFQGELVGPKIQSNRDRYEENEWHLFKIWDIDKSSFVPPAERREIAEELGIPHVHVVREKMKVFQELKTLDDMLAFVEGKTIRGFEREGYVFKDYDDPNISFKCINNKYLLKNADS